MLDYREFRRQHVREEDYGISEWHLLFKFRFPVVSEKDKNGLLHIISSIQVSCQANEDVKNRRQQGFVDFLDVYLNYYAVAAKRSTYFFFLKKKRSEFELCRKSTLDIAFPLYI
ncbi:uncharacterized protein LOC114969631 isoform X2 [Acropora millepora]|uniref:uncharacterized protein LOC114969631 isoform X2 n=1 Tax=Acropora millepora TaxID=45264 RepID=UPI001CF1295E|nr:uncharacterized protein LOC114969631 isoform X2 [Acropora millepora]